jgi:hypothetical protein
LVLGDRMLNEAVPKILKLPSALWLIKPSEHIDNLAQHLDVAL